MGCPFFITYHSYQNMSHRLLVSYYEPLSTQLGVIPVVLYAPILWWPGPRREAKKSSYLLTM
jgi:hypothetical protein